MVLKWVQDGEFVAAATMQQLLVQTSAEDWGQGLRNPEAWLKKECAVQQLSLSLDQHGGGGGGAPPHSYAPLLRIASLRAAALLPAFAWLEVRAGGPLPPSKGPTRGHQRLQHESTSSAAARCKPSCAADPSVSACVLPRFPLFPPPPTGR